MLTATILERVFVIVESKKEITLADPEPSWTPELVMNFYSPTYPLLTTATIEGPEIINDKRHYFFKTTIGTKG